MICNEIGEFGTIRLYFTFKVANYDLATIKNHCKCHKFTHGKLFDGLVDITWHKYFKKYRKSIK